MRYGRLGFGALSAVAIGLLSGTQPARADLFDTPNRQGALAGRTVVVSPGHGIRAVTGGYDWQRGPTPTSFADADRVREDIHTNEIVILYLQRYLSNAGAVVFSCRERSFQTHEVVVDDRDARYAETGLWTGSTSHPDFLGQGYRYTAASAVETAVARFTVPLPESGAYPVYVWYTPSANRSRDALYRVRHAGGTTAIRVDQQAYQAFWYYLGTYHFDAAQPAVVELSNQGSNPSTFVIADAVRIGGGVGPSGEPRWKEAAREWLPAMGYPGSAADDVTIRPSFANWIAGNPETGGVWRTDFRYVAVHTNAGSGSNRGTMTISYTNGRTPSWSGYGNGTAHYLAGLQAASDAFRDRGHLEVMRDLRAAYGTWSDQGLILLNLGELRLALAMPSYLTELAFHDSPGDVAYLRDEVFRHICGRALYKSVARSFDPQAVIVPLPPADVAAENLGGGRVRISWRAVQDPLESSAAPTGFKVYLGRDGRGFDNGVAVQGGGSTFIDVGPLAPGESVYARVAATNAGGESLPSRVVGARVPQPGAAVALIVNGFTRPFTHSYQNVEARFPDDLVAVHGQSFARATALGFDGAEARAVESGRVPLDGYALVDWFTGQESTRDETLSDAEQVLLQGYLGARGALLVSGAEIGWDLVQHGSAADSAFYAGWLGAAYLADDAGTRAVDPAGGSRFGALGRLDLDDGTAGGYAVRFPDVIAPSGAGAASALSYANGAGVAAVEVDRGHRVVYLGFPLEGIASAARRDALVAAAASFLAPQTSGGGGGSGGGGSGGGGTTGGGSTGGGGVNASSDSGGGGGGCAVATSGGAAAWLPTALGLLALAAARRRTRPARSAPRR